MKKLLAKVTLAIILVAIYTATLAGMIFAVFHTKTHWREWLEAIRTLDMPAWGWAITALAVIQLIVSIGYIMIIERRSEALQAKEDAQQAVEQAQRDAIAKAEEIDYQKWHARQTAYYDANPWAAYDELQAGLNGEQDLLREAEEHEQAVTRWEREQAAKHKQGGSA